MWCWVVTVGTIYYIDQKLLLHCQPTCPNPTVHPVPYQHSLFHQSTPSHSNFLNVPVPILADFHSNWFPCLFRSVPFQLVSLSVSFSSIPTGFPVPFQLSALPHSYSPLQQSILSHSTCSSLVPLQLSPIYSKCPSPSLQPLYLHCLWCWDLPLYSAVPPLPWPVLTWLLYGEVCSNRYTSNNFKSEQVQWRQLHVVRGCQPACWF